MDAKLNYLCWYIHLDSRSIVKQFVVYVEAECNFGQSLQSIKEVTKKKKYIIVKLIEFHTKSKTKLLS